MATADPVITYYCYYWAVKLALDQKLHNSSEEAMQYMLTLMEDLEKVWDKSVLLLGLKLTRSSGRKRLLEMILLRTIWQHRRMSRTLR